MDYKDQDTLILIATTLTLMKIGPMMDYVRNPSAVGNIVVTPTMTVTKPTRRTTNATRNMAGSASKHKLSN